jgi:hypothetical protein
LIDCKVLDVSVRILYQAEKRELMNRIYNAAVAAIIILMLQACASDLFAAGNEPSVPGSINTTGTVPSFRQEALNGNGNAGEKTTVVLFGERPQWNPEGKQPRIRDIITTASAILNANVVDATIPEEKLSDTANRIQSVLSSRPGAVIILSGRKDEKLATNDDAMRQSLTKIIQAFKQNNIQVFVVPSSTSVGAGVSGSLRVIATTTNASFIEPGTELAGHPYQEALGEISKALNVASAASSANASAPADGAEDHAASPLSTPAGLKPGSVPGSYSAGPAETPVTIQMTPPPAIKHFDPRETRQKTPPETKRPAVEK